MAETRPRIKAGTILDLGTSRAPPLMTTISHCSGLHQGSRDNPEARHPRVCRGKTRPVTAPEFENGRTRPPKHGERSGTYRTAVGGV